MNLESVKACWLINVCQVQKEGKKDESIIICWRKKMLPQKYFEVAN